MAASVGGLPQRRRLVVGVIVAENDAVVGVEEDDLVGPSGGTAQGRHGGPGGPGVVGGQERAAAPDQEGGGGRDGVNPGQIPLPGGGARAVLSRAGGARYRAAGPDLPMEPGVV